MQPKCLCGRHADDAPPTRSAAKCRRYEAPDEYPFTPLELLPKPILPPIEYPKVLYTPAVVNANDRIWQYYRDDVVPTITKKFGEVSNARTHERHLA